MCAQKTFLAEHRRPLNCRVRDGMLIPPAGAPSGRIEKMPAARFVAIGG